MPGWSRGVTHDISTGGQCTVLLVETKH